MNTRAILDSSAPPAALSVSFNADNSFFSVALENGFRIYSSKTAELNCVREVGGGIGCAEMLATAQYIALVGGGKQPKYPQNKVKIWNNITEAFTTSLELKTAILRVRISHSHLIVVQLNNVGIYKMKIPLKKVADYESVNNPFGLCCLGKGIVAFPGLTPGQVKLFDLATGNVSIIPAHNSPLRALALSQKGDMVATASEQGTIIRLWAFPSCTKITEFRRGVDPAVMFSLAFSPDGSMLAATSDKETLHIFDLSAPEPDPKTHKWGILSKVPLLPRQFSDTYPSASIKFEIGDEPLGGAASRSATLNAAIPGVPGGRPTKGLLGWLDDSTLLVVGAGHDARYERFIVGKDKDGRTAIERQGWKRYLD